jgi:hypothetical protein
MESISRCATSMVTPGSGAIDLDEMIEARAHVGVSEIYRG